MISPLLRQLGQVLQKIDRPGSFSVSGSAPALLPGLVVKGLGPIGLPFTAAQAAKLKKQCEQAPYGKGEKTLVDTSVRRVWRLKPDRFSLTNPEWEQFLRQAVDVVQQELGLEKQKLVSHLYDLLLYEKGSFFLPHRDGEKLDRMVATLVIVLPSSFRGGELVVRHDGQEKVIDFGGGEDDAFRIHFAAFYADCEHEVRPLQAGHRLCLVYNLTLAKAKKPLPAPRYSEAVEQCRKILADWATGPADETDRKLVVTLEHQYTADGLTWDVLKGVDRAKARVLLEAAGRADCQAHLALLTFHESGSAVEPDNGYGGYGSRYDRRRRWDDEDEEDEDEEEGGEYEMEEVFDSDLSADHWVDGEGKLTPIGMLGVEENEILNPDWFKKVVPEEEFEGYTGNAGMTLDRWYRRAAIALWPNKRHFAILCEAGSESAVQALGLMVKRWKKAAKKDADSLRTECITFATTIIAGWKDRAYAGYDPRPEPCPLMPSLEGLDDPGLIKAYLTGVVARDASVEPGKSLVRVCQKHGWETFRPELETLFKSTTSETIDRTVRLLEQFCLVKARKKEEWLGLCTALAQAAVRALEEIDQATPAHDYRAKELAKAELLAGLTRSLLATDQLDLLSRLVSHILARPARFPLTDTHVAALTRLGPWLGKHLKKPSPALTQWLAACCEQLEALTARTPQPPTDFRRSAEVSCKCKECAELKRFLTDPHEQVHRFRVREDLRRHLQDRARQHHCDLDFRTEETSRPYALVCTKNTASYQAKLKTFHEDQKHLAALRSIEAALPK
ncbi:MAG: hypothetical protein JWO38_4116 [Gemmataceae bacterium]|nr:hypothetical protein [Gemmataceae bacterium]